jgi:sugar phosphate isomerase/epimerase
MLWGYANGWYPEFLTRDEDELYAKLKFLLDHDLQETGVALDEVAVLTDEERDRLGTFLEDNGLHLTPSVWFDYLNTDEDEARREAEKIAADLRTCGPVMRAWSVMTKAGAGHRFDRNQPLEEKLERLCRSMAPLAKACHELDMPLMIDTQGDFYSADFVQMCERVPHLYIHVDTANLFWACERIRPAFERLAPYVIGTHWRDERITIGNRKPRGVLLHNCVTGQGDVPLRELYPILLDKAPDLDRLVMQLEMFGPSEMDPRECLEQSLAFFRSFREEN